MYRMWIMYKKNIAFFVFVYHDIDSVELSIEDSET